MLRASVEANSETVDLNAIVDGSVSSGIEHGAELTAFAEALVTHSDSTGPQQADRKGRPQAGQLVSV